MGQLSTGVDNNPTELTDPLGLGLREDLIKQIEELDPALSRLLPYLTEARLMHLLAQLQAKRAAAEATAAVCAEVATGVTAAAILLYPTTIACGQGESCPSETPPPEPPVYVPPRG